MKNILQALILFLLVGFSTNSHSQVTINFNSNEVIPIHLQDLYNTPYMVPSGKMLIITHMVGMSTNSTTTLCIITIDGGEIIVGSSNYPLTNLYCHIPVSSGQLISQNYQSSGSTVNIYGYLINMEDFGVGTDVPDDEIIDNGGGGIEIYPNPTDNLASVFVDYQGDWNMTVYDLNGQIVFECQSDTPVKSIDTNSLSAGTYIVSVRAKRKLIGSSQLIVQ